MTWKPEIPEFKPAMLRARAGGWTPARQRGFIAALAETANVRVAARSVGLSARAAYLLRARPEAAGFRDAWDEVIAVGHACAHDAAMSRAMNGTVEPVFYHGVKVGERRRDDDGLLIRLINRGDRLLARRDRSSHSF